MANAGRGVAGELGGVATGDQGLVDEEANGGGEGETGARIVESRAIRVRVRAVRGRDARREGG